MSSVSLLCGRQRWKSAEHVALSISVSLSPSYSACLSQCFWNDTEKMSMSCASVDTRQSRSVVKFYVAQSQLCCVSFSFFLSREGILHS